MRILAAPGVYRPLLDSRMLAAALGNAGLTSGSKLLDVCTGSGLLAVTGALLGAESTAVDVSRRAVLCAGLNARRHGVRVRALRGSLFEPVAQERFDCIVSNPPYVPSGSRGIPTRGPSRAWEGGPDGRTLLDRICREAPAYLRPGGLLLLVHTAHVDEHRTLTLLAASGMDAATVDRRTEPLGPIMSRRAQQGVFDGGTELDELVVIRATWDGAPAPSRPLPERRVLDAARTA